MGRKSQRITVLLEEFQGRQRDAHYLGYFDCFNRQLFYEAHDVLEELWLEQRQGPNGSFYKGLIQLAGAFVHLQKDRLGPAVAVFKLAEANLKQYPALHEGLEVDAVLKLIRDWVQRLESLGARANPLTPTAAPRLHLANP